jgi:uncharacterized repeat protein (TIGR03803 family)
VNQHFILVAITACVGAVISAPAATAGTPSIVYAFDNDRNSAAAQPSPVQFGNLLYGVTAGIATGVTPGGTIYSIDPNTASLTTLKRFSWYKGKNTSRPDGNMVQIGTLLYGSSTFGGSKTWPGDGTIFTFDPVTGKQKVVTNFSNVGAVLPVGGLATDGSNYLYGLSSAVPDDGIYGAVFGYDITNNATKALHVFNGGDDGSAASAPRLLYAGKTLYGTTSDGGPGQQGTIYKLNVNTGHYTVIHEFAGGTSDGAVPLAGLVILGQTLYGTASTGGSAAAGTLYSLDIKSGAYNTLYNFSATGPVGAAPAGLVEVNGLIYGTVTAGGAYGGGTLFSYDPNSGAISAVCSFNPSQNLDGPTGITYAAGSFYGVGKYFSGGLIWQCSP